MATATATPVTPAASSSGSHGSDLHLENVLSQSRSPYVRAHMHNPVAWQTWSPETLALAKKHNRLLFLSVGYAACHWCHVMERESFENEAVAAVLNRNFIPVKMDREERPDIDRIYMNYVQASTGRGGWPMSVFITPDLEPVFGGTYWPGPDSPAVMGGAHPGFLGILERVRSLWDTQRERCVASAKDVTRQLREFAQEGTLGDAAADDAELELLEEAYQHFETKFDEAHGGFSAAPKFPTPANLSFLLQLGAMPAVVQDVVGRDEVAHARTMAIETLRAITRGGIHDQIGGGFARYSVTRDWSLPHFEKMLYDNAQLLGVFVDAFLVTGDAEMLGAVYDVAGYLTSAPMAAASGGFFSSEDADSALHAGDASSDKREGAFYVWTHKELTSVLSADEADVACAFWGVQPSGNVAREHDAHDELLNQNVLCIRSSPDAIARERGLAKDAVVAHIKSARAKLRAHRDATRPRPGLDDKIVAGWNGLAIGALARASSVLASVPGAAQADECLAAAEKAAAFVRRELFDESSGRMRRVYRQGAGEAPAFADDYAYMISGLIELYEATFDDSYLEFAERLQQTQTTLFADPRGGFFSTEAHQADTLLRLKDGLDGAEPSTNGLSAVNLLRLSALLADEDLARSAARTVAAFATELGQHPFLFASMLPAVAACRLGGAAAATTGGTVPATTSILLSGTSPQVTSAVRAVRLRLKPNTSVARVGPGARSDKWLVQRNALAGALDAAKAGVQVCLEGACRDVSGEGELEKVLAGDGVV